MKSTARGLQLLRVQTGKLRTWFQHGSGAVIPVRYRTGWAPIHIGNKATALRWEHTTTNMAAATTGGGLNAMHRYKLPPPHFTGEYATFEAWKRKFVAYLGLQNSQFPRLLQIAETFDQPVTDDLLQFFYRRSRPLDTTQQTPTLPTHQRLPRTSSCPLQTAYTTSSWSRDMETTTQTLFNSHLVHAVSGTLQSFWNHSSTKTNLRSLLQHGNLK